MATFSVCAGARDQTARCSPSRSHGLTHAVTAVPAGPSATGYEQISYSWRAIDAELPLTSQYADRLTAAAPLFNRSALYICVLHIGAEASLDVYYHDSDSDGQSQALPAFTHGSCPAVLSPCLTALRLRSDMALAPLSADAFIIMNATALRIAAVRDGSRFFVIVAAIDSEVHVFHLVDDRKTGDGIILLQLQHVGVVPGLRANSRSDVLSLTRIDATHYAIVAVNGSAAGAVYTLGQHLCRLRLSGIAFFLYSSPLCPGSLVPPSWHVQRVRTAPRTAADAATTGLANTACRAGVLGPKASYSEQEGSLCTCGLRKLRDKQRAPCGCPSSHFAYHSARGAVVRRPGGQGTGNGTCEVRGLSPSYVFTIRMLFVSPSDALLSSDRVWWASALLGRHLFMAVRDGSVRFLPARNVLLA